MWSFLCSVERLQGSFGTVEIRVISYLFNDTTGELTSTSTVTDLSPTTWLLTFSEGDTLATFDLDIIDELTPEFEERFELVLTIESSTGDSDDGARLGTSSRSLIVVAENDDPHGLFVISTLTSDVEVAEDVGETEDGGTVDVIVERTFGDSGSVQVRNKTSLNVQSKIIQLYYCSFFSCRFLGNWFQNWILLCHPFLISYFLETEDRMC